MNAKDKRSDNRSKYTLNNLQTTQCLFASSLFPYRATKTKINKIKHTSKVREHFINTRAKKKENETDHLLSLLFSFFPVYFPYKWDELHGFQRRQWIRALTNTYHCTGWIYLTDLQNGWLASWQADSLAREDWLERSDSTARAIKQVREVTQTSRCVGWAASVREAAHAVRRNKRVMASDI